MENGNYGNYRPGEIVPASGIYRVEHSPHRLIHSATLVATARFPLCKQCRHAVRFFLVRAVKDSHVLPFRSNAILEEYKGSDGPRLLKTG